MHFLDVYDQHFSKFRGKDVCVVEIGVGHGGSLQMWKDYFGPKSRIYGGDIHPELAGFREDQIVVFPVDQRDRESLRAFAQKVGKIDVLIDDGSHHSPDQINTFEELFPLLSEEAIYACEDLQTSYSEAWEGGKNNPNAFVEYLKRMVDYLNGERTAQDQDYAQKFPEMVRSVNFYCYAVVIEKSPMAHKLFSPIMSGVE